MSGPALPVDGRWATLVLKNGRVFTMDPACPMATAVAAQGEHILAVGSDTEIEGFVRPDKTKVYDVCGKVVAPGFIDIHVHLERGSRHVTALWARQGVTTVVTGNCGVSSPDVGEYLRGIDVDGARCDVATLVGSDQVRRAAGVTSRYSAASTSQMTRLRDATRDALLAGAVGISVGPDYAPGMSFDEQVALAEVAAAERTVVTSHVRVQRGRGQVAHRAAIEEFLAVGRIAGSSLEISHITSVSGRSYDEVYELVEAARHETLDVTADCYPYDAWSTGIQTAVFDGDWRAAFGVDFSDVEVVGGPCTGVRLDEALFARLRAAPHDTAVVGHGIPWEAVTRVFCRPWCMVASDGIPGWGTGEDIGHPRQAGTFSRVLARLVREEGVLTLTDALMKMTSLPAWRLQLPGKGRIAPGFDADLVVFDRQTVKDQAGYAEAECRLPPQGIALVFLRGRLGVRDGACLGPPPGRALRRTCLSQPHTPVITSLPTLAELTQGPARGR